MSTIDCVLRCTADGRIVKIDAHELHSMILDADEFVKTLPNLASRAAYFMRLAAMCESSGNLGQGMSMLRKALAMYCSHDLEGMTTRYVHAAKRCAKRIDRLRWRAFGGEQSFSVLGDVTAFYEHIYWMVMLDEQPEVWDYCCERGEVHTLDSAAWHLISSQLTNSVVKVDSIN